MVYLPVCQSGLSVIQGENHSTGGWHSLSGSLVKRCRGSVGQRVGLYPSQPLVTLRFRRRGQRRPGRTALRLLPIRRHRLSRASRLGRTRRATRVCFRRDTPWVKLAFQASFRWAVLRSISGCCRACISRARFLSSWQAWSLYPNYLF